MEVAEALGSSKRLLALDIKAASAITGSPGRLVACTILA
jgi:hypothetical protein